MNKVNPLERGAAAGAALLVTLAVVWAFASMGYPAPAEGKPSIAASASTLHCRPG